jgi:hypothetical protein
MSQIKEENRRFGGVLRAKISQIEEKIVDLAEFIFTNKKKAVPLRRI